MTKKSIILLGILLSCLFYSPKTKSQSLQPLPDPKKSSYEKIQSMIEKKRDSEPKIESINWSSLANGLSGGVWAIEVVDTNEIYVGGNFSTAYNNADSPFVSNVAKWNGNSWAALGFGANNQVLAITNSAPYIFIGGNFTQVEDSTGPHIVNYIAKWNGVGWASVGTSGNGVNSGVNCIESGFGKIYVGGKFTDAGGISANFIAQYDGTNDWQALGSGVNNWVAALAFDAVNSFLFVGGDFTQAGGNSANYIAKWNGTSWANLGTGVNNSVTAIGIASNGDVYAGGFFTQAGGNSANNIAKWNGASWESLGGGIGTTTDEYVTSIIVKDSFVYVGGEFNSAGGVPVKNLARWDGSTWMDVGGGTNTYINVLESISNEPSIWVGGLFDSLGNGTPMNSIAKFTDTDLIPVELALFNAGVEGNSVKLSWTTATEKNTQAFFIERKYENENWNNIGRIDAAGTSTELKHYEYFDQNVLNGNYTYRLRIVDFDGSFTYSPSIEIKIGSPIDFALEQNYPNPFNPGTTINFSLPKTSNVKLVVYNQIGEEVKTLLNQEMNAGKYAVTFNGNNLPSGIYFYKLEAGNFTQTKKCILIK